MIYNIKTETKLASFSVVYMGSTANEKIGNRGISHLMEHLLCKNLEYRNNDYDSDGITFNAYTESDRIVFYISGLESRLTKYRNEFVREIGRFDNITEEDFLKERNIIISEYNDFFNEYQHHLNFDRKHFNDYGPIGCMKDLESLTFDDLKEFYEKQFKKPHYIINASQNSLYSTDIEFETKIPIKNIEYNTTHDYIEEDIAEYSDVQKEIIITSDIIEGYKDILIGKMYSRMISFGLQSPLYTKVREENGLVYYIYSYIKERGNNAVVMTYTSTATENVDNVIGLIDEVMNDDSWITEERFNIIYNNVEVRKELESISIHDNLNYFFTHKTALQLHYKTITLQDIKDFHNKYIVGDKYKKAISVE